MSWIKNEMIIIKVLKLKNAEYNQLQTEIEELNQEVQRLITKT